MTGRMGARELETEGLALDRAARAARGFSHVAVIANPRSGRGRFAQLRPRIEAAFAARGEADRLSIHETRGRGDGARFAAEALARWVEGGLVVVAGGDGSLSEVAEVLAGSRLPLLLLPVGSGNDFARSIYRGATRRLPQLLAATGLVAEAAGAGAADAAGGEGLALAGLLRLHAIDVIELSSKAGAWRDDERLEDLGPLTGVAVNAVSLGLDSSVAMFANRFSARYRSLGSMTYILGVVRNILRVKGLSLELRSAGREAEGWRRLDYTLGAICNASFYGGGFQPNPDGLIDDGLLDMRLSRVLSFGDVLRLAASYRRGSPRALSYFEHERCAWLEARMVREEDPLLLTVDGEGLIARDVALRLRPRALQLALPAAYASPPCLGAAD